MALDRVVQAIIADGRKEAQAVAERAREEAERIVGEARSEGAKLIERRLEEAERLAKRMAVQETARAEIEAKKGALRAQKEVLDGILHSAMKSVGERWGSARIETALRQLPPEMRGGLVYSNSRDRAAVEKIAAAHGLRYAETIECLGGIIVESPDRSIRADLRLEAMMGDVWSESVIEVASILWGEG